MTLYDGMEMSHIVDVVKEINLKIQETDDSEEMVVYLSVQSDPGVDPPYCEIRFGGVTLWDSDGMCRIEENIKGPFVGSRVKEPLLECLTRGVREFVSASARIELACRFLLDVPCSNSLH